MGNYRFVPIVNWPVKPTPYSARKRAPFSASQSRTLSDLERELDHLGARTVVIQTYHRESEIRLDGMPKASAPSPANPSVILSFTTARGDYSYPCDTYMTWTGNLRAIVLTLEHLRAVERYGVTKHGQQYAGFKALPSVSDGARMSAAIAVARHAQSDYSAADIRDEPVCREAAYKIAVQRVHPDRPGGSHEAFVDLQRAIEVLRAS